jgi:uncharacterized membrane protein
VAICLTKPPYALLAGLALLVPADRFPPGERRRRLAVLFAAVLAAAAVTLWLGYWADVPVRPGAERGLQIRDALLEPGRFAVLVWNDAVAHGPRYLAQLVGAQLGWVDTRVPWVVIYAYLVMLVLLAIVEVDVTRTPSPRQRAILGAVVVITVLAVVASQYARWTPYRATSIEGVQGRYFLPIAPAAALLFQWGRVPGRIDLRRYAAWSAALIAVALVVSLVAVAYRYYS